MPLAWMLRCGAEVVGSLVVTVMVHEVAHALSAWCCGAEAIRWVGDVRLWQVGVRVTWSEHQPPSFLGQLLFWLSGAVANAAMAALAWWCARPLDAVLQSAMAALALWPWFAGEAQTDGAQVWALVRAQCCRRGG